jgi:hypothetical protein
MTSVTIVPVSVENGGTMYRAMCGQLRSSGSTAGEALDAITLKLTGDKRRALIVVQDHIPDLLFSAESGNRLRELMAEWRQARDADLPFDSAKQSELDALVDGELAAATQRSADAVQETGV